MFWTNKSVTRVCLISSLTDLTEETDRITLLLTLGTIATKNKHWVYAAYKTQTLGTYAANTKRELKC